jgi:hypothetical protein
MAIKVTLPSSATSSRSGSIPVVKSKVQTATKLEGLANVDLADAQDGYTFTYNAASGKWEATPVSGLAIDSGAIQNLDGGTF